MGAERKDIKVIYILALSVLIVVAIMQAGCAGSSAKDKKSAAAQWGQFKATNIKEQIQYNRAVQAVIWGMPVVNYELMYQAAVRDGEAGFNKVVYWSRPSDWKNQILTPNSEALYVLVFTNTKEVGPLVLEVPPADDGTIVGTVMDCWQTALEDVGPAGADKGKGGRYLILPPDYKDKVPSGFIVLHSSTYTGYAVLRSIPKTKGEEDIATAATYLKRIRLYPLSAADNPPQTTFVDVKDKVFDANITYDSRFFESLNRVIQVEPWLERDRAMIDNLKTIGIEKGKPFAPDEKTTAMFKAAALDARRWLAQRYESFSPYYTGKHWVVPVDSALINAITTGYKVPDSYPVDARGVVYYFACTSTKRLGKGQFYLVATRDGKGRTLDGNKNYKLTVPSKVPAQQYWSATVYDFETHAFIRNAPVCGRSSLAHLQSNENGSIDIYFGPNAPEGKESNWIPTKLNARFEVMFRLYGPDPSLFDRKTWVLNDIQEVK